MIAGEAYITFPNNVAYELREEERVDLQGKPVVLRMLVREGVLLESVEQLREFHEERTRYFRQALDAGHLCEESLRLLGEAIESLVLELSDHLKLRASMSGEGRVDQGQSQQQNGYDEHEKEVLVATETDVEVTDPQNSSRMESDLIGSVDDPIDLTGDSTESSKEPTPGMKDETPISEDLRNTRTSRSQSKIPVTTRRGKTGEPPRKKWAQYNKADLIDVIVKERMNSAVRKTINNHFVRSLPSRRPSRRAALVATRKMAVGLYSSSSSSSDTDDSDTDESD